MNYGNCISSSAVSNSEGDRCELQYPECQAQHSKHKYVKQHRRHFDCSFKMAENADGSRRFVKVLGFKCEEKLYFGVSTQIEV